MKLYQKKNLGANKSGSAKKGELQKKWKRKNAGVHKSRSERNGNIISGSTKTETKKKAGAQKSGSAKEAGAQRRRSAKKWEHKEVEAKRNVSLNNSIIYSLWPLRGHRSPFGRGEGVSFLIPTSPLEKS